MGLYEIRIQDRRCVPGGEVPGPYVCGVRHIPITAQLNQPAAQGWELVQIAKVDVVGKVFKSSERRDVAVAVYRRPVG